MDILSLSNTVLGISVTLFAVIAGSIAVGAVGRFVVRRIVSRIVKRTPYRWDTLLYRRGLFSSAVRFLPPLLIYLSLPVAFPETNEVQLVMERVAVAWMIAVAIRIVSPVGILGGVGALSAVLLLVFRDAILGFVSAVQLSANNMVSIGDWIEVPKYGADGPVTDITLQTVKVRNWDQTITSLPSYALISDSFKNWRGINEAGGRRIKRSIYIDIRSISFCTEEQIERFRRMPLIAEYMEQKLSEIADSTGTEDPVAASDDSGVAARTGLERGSCESDMTVGRQLQPGPYGVPLEIYCFTKETQWIGHEAVQSDMFDHFLAILPQFGLRSFQQPSGWDLNELGHPVSAE